MTFFDWPSLHPPVLVRLASLSRIAKQYVQSLFAAHCKTDYHSRLHSKEYKRKAELWNDSEGQQKNTGPRRHVCPILVYIDISPEKNSHGTDDTAEPHLPRKLDIIRTRGTVTLTNFLTIVPRYARVLAESTRRPTKPAVRVASPSSTP